MRPLRHLRPLRPLLAALCLSATCAGALATEIATGLATGHAAQLERRLFIVANNPDGYGIDRCLANGERCGSAIATSFCRSRDFVTAQSFHKVDREDITGAIPVGGPTGACGGELCKAFVAIECTR
jgi:hypothetical protein